MSDPARPTRFRAPPPGSLSRRGHVPIGDFISKVCKDLDAARDRALREPRKPKHRFRSELDKPPERAEFYVLVVKIHDTRFRAETVEPVYGSPLTAYGDNALTASRMLHWEYAKRLHQSGREKDWEKARRLAANATFIPNEIVSADKAPATGAST